MRHELLLPLPAQHGRARSRSGRGRGGGMMLLGARLRLLLHSSDHLLLLLRRRFTVQLRPCATERRLPERLQPCLLRLDGHQQLRLKRAAGRQLLLQRHDLPRQSLHGRGGDC